MAYDELSGNVTQGETRRAARSRDDSSAGARCNKHFSREPEVDRALRHPYKVRETMRQRCFEDAALRACEVE